MCLVMGVWWLNDLWKLMAFPIVDEGRTERGDDKNALIRIRTKSNMGR